MQRVLPIFIMIAVYISGYTQKPVEDISEKLKSMNAQIDEGIVKKDIHALELLYADDFVFTHGTGHVDNKTSWLKSVSNPDQQFVSRVHDSTQVEMHGDVAILTGKLEIRRDQKGKPVVYGIWYVRVFAFRKEKWQLISHRTTKEWHYKN